jgi:ribose transport system permease protein
MPAQSTPASKKPWEIHSEEMTTVPPRDDVVTDATVVLPASEPDNTAALERVSIRTPAHVATGLGRLSSQARHLQLARLSGVYLWALIILVFALSIPSTFLTSTTATNIASTQAITAIVAIGLLGALSAGNFDLSVGSNLGLAAVLCSWLTVHAHINVGLAVLLTLAVGVTIGVLNATLVVFVGIDSFIVTLGVSSTLLAVTELVSNSQFIGPVPQSLQDFVNWRELGINGVTCYALVIAVLAWVVLEHTPIGRRTAATGANLEAARLAGVATTRYRFTTLVVTGLFASLAGVLVAAKTGEVSATIGAPYLLPAFSACFLGTTQFKPGRFNVWGTVLALLLLGTGVTGLQLVGGQMWISDMFTGVALVIAVAFAVLGQKRRLQKMKRDLTRRGDSRAASPGAR